MFSKIINLPLAFMVGFVLIGGIVSMQMPAENFAIISSFIAATLGGLLGMYLVYYRMKRLLISIAWFVPMFLGTIAFAAWYPLLTMNGMLMPIAVIMGLLSVGTGKILNTQCCKS
jgi:hypothetical protein